MNGSFVVSLAYETIVTVGVEFAGNVVKAVAWLALLLVDTFILITCNANTSDWFAGQASIA